MERARQDPNNHEYFKEWDKANGVVAKTDPVEEKYDYSKFTKTLTE